VNLDLKPGQAVMPGQAVVTVASVDEFQAETTDLSEKDIARVRVGQPAVVTIEALGVDVPGKVERINARASKVGGDVVFKVVIRLDQQPEGMLWGMSVKAVISPE
jgi:HlyD family secretion protein